MTTPNLFLRRDICRPFDRGVTPTPLALPNADDLADLPVNVEQFAVDGFQLPYARVEGIEDDTFRRRCKTMTNLVIASLSERRDTMPGPASRQPVVKV
ncbi:MAG: hypothetical protein OXF02_00445 [Simkaniaceae bacterium]|nr:hypothetical protein [Simkaniaceae bacterium]